ncbi:unnamed protein product [Rhizophagus irregularis]|nr:unnamed protein product [Rhizophagus irregularis]
MKKNLIVMLLNNWNKKARMISNGVFVGATEKSTDGKKNKDKRCRDTMLAKKMMVKPLRIFLLEIGI